MDNKRISEKDFLKSKKSGGYGSRGYGKPPKKEEAPSLFRQKKIFPNEN